jgi:uncharacterized Zn finger protein (UPF0148 family)
VKNKNDRQEEGTGEKRMELKYCERCGGLWIRESGAGTVYCGSCQPEVEGLPIPKKKPGRVRMPVRPHTRVEDYATENPGEDEMNFEAGGAA